MNNIKLKAQFPFQSVFNDFLEEYSKCLTYWYFPKARSIDDKTIKDVKKTLNIIFEDYLEKVWNQNTQDELLSRLTKEKILEPYKEGVKQDRTALTRIQKKLWEVLGVIWVEDNKMLTITDVGLDLLSAEKFKDAKKIVESQIAKWQYPNPTMPHLKEFKGILPHLFLLQVLQKVNYKLSFNEYELFINISQSQNDLPRIVKYIDCWRNLTDKEKNEVLKIVKKIPQAKHSDSQMRLMKESKKEQSTRTKRYKKLSQDASYQRSFFAYPDYLEIKGDKILCTSKKIIKKILESKLNQLKIPSFNNKPDWFAYYGDPKQQPSWFTYLSIEVEQADSQEQAQKIVRQAKRKLTPEEGKELKKKEIEKGIEDFYIDRLSQIEAGLKLYKEKGKITGRQYSTPIGRIDLLCKSEKTRDYVIIEIKADEASDSSFGQILRYIGWVHSNFDDGRNKVRGIILAADFPDKARYSRIGLLKTNYKQFLKFSKHGFKLEEV